jgi:hypothetical protein
MYEAQGTADSIVMGRRMLVSLPSSTKDSTRSILGILGQAKARWDLRVDVLCAKTDRNGFQQLVGSSGKFFLVPHLLRTQDWELDPEQVAATERRIHEAELAAGLPIGRFVMGAAHTVGRAFSAPVRMVRPYPLVRRVLKDNSEPFRIIRRLFHFADEMLAASDPDFVCAHEYATLLNASLWFAANLRGIPCVSTRYSKINSHHSFWSTNRLMLNIAAIEGGAVKRKSGMPVSDAAKAHINAFREQPVTVHYIANKWRNWMSRGFVGWHLRNARIVGRQLIDRLRGEDQALVEPPLSRLLRYYRSLVANYRQQRFLHSFDEHALAAMKYVYFPMHKEAELALAVQATQWYDQRNTVRTLASVLPFGYRLLVRENVLNYGNCPTHIYRGMSQIPNVVLVDPFDSQFKYLRHAELVVTENGSSGWEGLMLARRVFLLARTFYDGAGLGVRVTDPDRLNAAILDVLARPAVADPAAHDHALGYAIDAELETNFPIGSESATAALDRLASTLCPALPQRSSLRKTEGASETRESEKHGAPGSIQVVDAT